jgi:hypothetical protein
LIRIPPVVSFCPVSFDSVAKEMKEGKLIRNQCGQYFGLDILHANSFKRALDGTKRFVLSFRHTNQVLILDEKYEVTHVVGTALSLRFEILYNFVVMVLVEFTFINLLFLFLSRFLFIHSVGGRGMNRNTFQFTNESDRFLAQHDAWLLEDGSLLMWDNGSNRNFTRAVRYVLNYTTMTLTKV